MCNEYFYCEVCDECLNTKNQIQCQSCRSELYNDEISHILCDLCINSDEYIKNKLYFDKNDNSIIMCNECLKQNDQYEVYTNIMVGVKPNNPLINLTQSEYINIINVHKTKYFNDRCQYEVLNKQFKDHLIRLTYLNDKMNQLF